VDSLGLQARVLAPAGTASDAVLAPATYPGSFPRRKYRFEREGDAVRYAVSGSGVRETAVPGQPVRLPVGTVTLRVDSLPPSFTVEFADREDAITRTAQRLSVEKAGREVGRVTFRSNDSLTSARVPNALLAVYLERRKTTDRGTNQRRLEFLVGLADTVARRLAEGERRLRLFQEASGVLDPELMGRAQLERAMALRQQLEQIEVEAAALNQMIAQAAAGSLTTRQLAAYPTFLRSQAINDLLSQAATLETERLRLAERRTDRDPEVQAITQSIRNLDDQLTPLATAYANALARQRQEIATQLDTVRAALAAMPGQTETSLQLQREVQRLGQTVIALQTQVVEARLAAISEGGDVRQIDVAQPPKKPVFPRRLLTLALGLAGGLLFGFLAALKAAFLGRWIRRPEDVERAVGLPGVLLETGAPLLLGGLAGYRTILVVPLGRGADTEGVTRQLAQSAAERAVAVTVAEPPTTTPSPGGVLQAMRELEDRYALVIAPLPRLDGPATAALLDATRSVLFVARSGRLARRDLVAAVETLRRLGIPCSGVVLHGPVQDGDSSR
jgi:tyrosine-protein kinase Etk/Wzc